MNHIRESRVEDCVKVFADRVQGDQIADREAFCKMESELGEQQDAVENVKVRIIRPNVYEGWRW